MPYEAQSSPNIGEMECLANQYLCALIYWEFRKQIHLSALRLPTSLDYLVSRSVASLSI